MDRNSKVMVVDDEPTIRKFVTAVLRMSGYSVIDAAPEQAMGALESNSEVDLLVTDVMMPSVTGCELAAQMRRRSPNLRVMFMSGYGADITATAGVAGALFLAKPFHIPQLLDLVKQALG